MNTHHPHRLVGAALAGLLTFGAAACGDDAVAGDDPVVDDPGTPGTEGPGTDDPTNDEFPVDDARQRAHGLLGVHEDTLGDDVRIARRGDETMALTEDYVLGRMTVELDDTDGSGYRVVRVTVELPAGPESLDLTPS